MILVVRNLTSKGYIENESQIATSIKARHCGSRRICQRPIWSNSGLGNITRPLPCRHGAALSHCLHARRGGGLPTRGIKAAAAASTATN